jgi:hypothetical protein
MDWPVVLAQERSLVACLGLRGPPRRADRPSRVRWATLTDVLECDPLSGDLPARPPSAMSIMETLAQVAEGQDEDDPWLKSVSHSENFDDGPGPDTAPIRWDFRPL